MLLTVNLDPFKFMKRALDLSEYLERSKIQFSIAAFAYLPIGTSLVLDTLPKTLRKDISSSKSSKLIFAVSETLNPDEYINSTIARSRISIESVGLKLSN